MPDPGLCAGCLHGKLVRGARSQFWMCERSRIDARFPRYPPLPVLRCAGFSRRPEGAGGRVDHPPGAGS